VAEQAAPSPPDLIIAKGMKITPPCTHLAHPPTHSPASPRVNKITHPVARGGVSGEILLKAPSSEALPLWPRFDQFYSPGGIFCSLFLGNCEYRCTHCSHFAVENIPALKGQTYLMKSTDQPWEPSLMTEKVRAQFVHYL
jgi:hypothetical protein